MAPHVLILGGGLGGLTLAQSLRKRGVSSEIFERDEHIKSRSGGWAIALHTILDDLKASLPDDVPSLELTNHLLPLDLSAELCFYDGGPMRAVVRSTSDHPIIRANRQKLRDVLSTGLNIKWGVQTRNIEEVDGKVKLTFDDGRYAIGDVLVGADGAGSFVRRHLLPGRRPSILPAGVINGEVTLTDDEFKRQLKLAHSAYVAAAESFHLYVGLKEVSADGNQAQYYWYLNFYDSNATQEPFWTASVSPQEMYDFALEKTKALNPAHSRIVNLTNAKDIKSPPIVFRDMLLEDDALAIGRVTLLGDAAHPMAPFRGEGGRHAFEDALRLSHILASANIRNIPKLLKTYEKEMLSRGRDAVCRSRAVLDPEQGADMKIAWGQPLQVEKIGIGLPFC